MKIRIGILLILIAGLVGVQGCRTAGGEWFPKSGKPARKQTFHDKETENESCIAELIVDVLDYSVNH
jgi:hypothetical protein